MAGILLPSATNTVIAWAKANPQIAAQFGTRVASVLPDNPGFPFLTVQRITGVPQLNEVSIDFARVQFNTWGGTKDNGKPDWAKADLPMRVVEAEIRAFRGEEVPSEGAYIMEMAPYEGMQQLQDPDTNDARFWMDALVVIRRMDGQ